MTAYRSTVIAMGLLGALLTQAATADQDMRITQLQRCGDLFSKQALSWCLRTRGLPESEVELKLDGRPLRAEQIRRDGERMRLTLAPDELRSGPLWLEHGGRRSNPVWLSAGRSQVVAARADEVTRNMDGLTTYVDLVSLIIEEDHEGLAKAQQLAEKYGAKLVGAIPRSIPISCACPWTT